MRTDRPPYWFWRIDRWVWLLQVQLAVWYLLDGQPYGMRFRDTGRQGTQDMAIFPLQRE